MENRFVSFVRARGLVVRWEWSDNIGRALSFFLLDRWPCPFSFSLAFGMVLTYNVLTFNVLAFNVLAFNVLAFNVLTFNVVTFNVLTLNVLTFSVFVEMF